MSDFGRAWEVNGKPKPERIRRWFVAKLCAGLTAFVFSVARRPRPSLPQRAKAPAGDPGSA